MAKRHKKENFGLGKSLPLEDEMKYSNKQEETLTFPELKEIFEDTLNGFSDLLEQIDPEVRSKVNNRRRKSKNLSGEYHNEEFKYSDEKPREYYDHKPETTPSSQPTAESLSQLSESGSQEYGVLTTEKTKAPSKTRFSRAIIGPLAKSFVNKAVEQLGESELKPQFAEFTTNKVVPSAVDTIVDLVQNWTNPDTQAEYGTNATQVPSYQPHPNVFGYVNQGGFYQSPDFGKTSCYCYPQGHYQPQIFSFPGQNGPQVPPYQPHTLFGQGQFVPGPQSATPLPPYSGNPPPIQQTVPSPSAGTNVTFKVASDDATGGVQSLPPSSGQSPLPTKTRLSPSNARKLDNGRSPRPTRSGYPDLSHSTGRLSYKTLEYDKSNNEVLQALKDINDHINYMLKKSGELE